MKVIINSQLACLFTFSHATSQNGQKMLTRKIDPKTRKKLRIGLTITILLAVWALFSPWGAIRHYQLSERLEQLETNKLNLQEINRELREEINNLNNNPAYIENVARKQYGLLKNNEFIYIFPNGKKDKQ